jgi:Rrf2 family protein
MDCRTIQLHILNRAVGPVAKAVSLALFASVGQIKRMLSSKGKYAVRAATMLAEQYASAAWISTGAIAEREKIPRKFLETILVQLRDGGLVDSRRGPQGGHRLSRAPATVSLADIIRLIDGPLALTPCASVTRFRSCTDCGDAEACRLQHVMRQARDAVAAVLENCSLMRMAGEVGPGQTALSRTQQGQTLEGETP